MNLLSKKTTGTGTAQSIVDLGNCHTIYITWGADCTAGGVTIEEAPYPAYAGVWADIGTGEVLLGANAGACVSINVQHKPIAAVRARITTPVTGTGAAHVSVDLETS